MDRKQFITTIAGAAATTIVGSRTALAGNDSQSTPAPTHNIKRGVSLYSYQQANMLNGMTLEEMLEEISDIGAFGIEIMGQALVDNYPYPTEKWLSNWWDMMDKYGTQPVCYTDFYDQWIQKTRPMSTQENLEYLVRDLTIAKKMGISNMRMLIGTPIELIEAAIPVAERMGIWMGIELHAPVLLKSKFIDTFTAVAEKHPETFGFIPDMALFQRYPRPYTRNKQIADGILTEETAFYIEDSFKKGMDKKEVEAKVEATKNSKPGDKSYVETVYSSAATYNDPKDLLPILKYCRHIHAKFYEMSKGNEFYDTTIDYENVIPVLIEGGYNGYICSEYEGQRSMDIADVDEIEEVRRQHVMLKRMLGV